MTNGNPVFKCELQNDEYTLRVDAGGIKGFGNNALKYPVALMTADEFIFAGSVSAVNNSNNYLFFEKYYWSMTPGTFGSVRVGTHVLDNGAIYNDRVVYKEGIFPVISLKSNVLIKSGVGTLVDPYIVK